MMWGEDEKIFSRTWLLFLLGHYGYGQSPSFKTFMNTVIPGDHPDPTLTKIGKYFYTSGSSFNPTRGHMFFCSGKYWHFFGRGGGSLYIAKINNLSMGKVDKASEGLSLNLCSL